MYLKVPCRTESASSTKPWVHHLTPACSMLWPCVSTASHPQTLENHVHKITADCAERHNSILFTYQFMADKKSHFSVGHQIRERKRKGAECSLDCP